MKEPVKSLKKITGGQLFQVPNKNLYMLAQLSKGRRNEPMHII